MAEQDDFDAAFSEFSDPEIQDPNDMDLSPENGDDNTESFDHDTDNPDQVDASSEDDSDNTPDPWEGLSDNQIQRVKALEDEKEQWRHRFQSDAGRVSALQRKLNAMNAAPEEGPSGKDVAKAMETDESWNEFKDSYPEIATVIDKRLTRGLDDISSNVGKRVANIEKNDRKRYITEQVGILAHDHEDYMEVLKSAEFDAWFREQPNAVQAVGASNKASELSWLIKSFKDAKGRTQRQDQDSGGDAAAAIKAEREKRLRTSQEPAKSRGNRPKPVAKDDYDGAFAAFAAQKDRRRV